MLRKRSAGWNPRLPSRTILDRGLTLLNGFSLLVNKLKLVNFFFIFGRAVDYARLTASFRAHVNIVFFTYFTYLLDNEFGSFFRPIVTESTEATNVTDIFTLKIVIQSKETLNITVAEPIQP